MPSHYPACLPILIKVESVLDMKLYKSLPFKIL